MVIITEEDPSSPSSSFYQDMGLKEFDDLVNSLSANLDIISISEPKQNSTFKVEVQKSEEKPVVSGPICCPACKLAVTAKDSRLFVSGKAYHEKCFACYICDQKFGAKVPYIEKTIKDHNDQTSYSHNDQYSSSHKDQPSSSHKDQPSSSQFYYCEGCYDTQFGIQCDECKQVMKCGQVLNVMNKSFHAECFKCDGCKSPFFIGDGDTVAYLEFKGKPFCNECYVVCVDSASTAEREQ